MKFYVTKEEKNMINHKMKLLKTDNMGVYLCKISIDGFIINVDHTYIKNQTAEIQKIGVCMSEQS